jgi:Cys-tRNA synthase (O-phospho-L-seryl-tRNA:Cys-tRNA synthase)
MARGIKIKKIGSASFRMVCHYGIGSEDVDQVLVALRDIIKGNARA